MGQLTKVPCNKFIPYSFVCLVTHLEDLFFQNTLSWHILYIIYVCIIKRLNDTALAFNLLQL